MTLTISSCFFIYREYVNLLIWLWPYFWPFCLAFSFLESTWTCWFDSDHASDYSVLFSHARMYVNLLIWLWPYIWPFWLAFSCLVCMWTCLFDSDHASDHSILLSHFQFVCELVGLTLTMHMTILSCFLISREYVNLVIWLWPCLWWLHLAVSFIDSMSTC